MNYVLKTQLIGFIRTVWWFDWTLTEAKKFGDCNHIMIQMLLISD